MSATDLGGGVCRVTLNDPENRNAMSEMMAEEFASLVTSLNEQKDIRVVILTGEGTAFSAGGHLEMLLAKTKLPWAENERRMLRFYEQFLSLRALPVPVIAAVNGHAMGAGLCLALSCDIRLAHSDAKLGLNFVQLGLHPGMGATYFLPRLIGQARAAELLYCGRILSACEAESIGLVNRCIPEEEFLSVVQGTARLIASAGAQAIRELKRNLLSAPDSLASCLAREAEAQALDYAGAEFRERITAAIQRRKEKL